MESIRLKSVFNYIMQLADLVAPPAMVVVRTAKNLYQRIKSSIFWPYFTPCGTKRKIRECAEMSRRIVAVPLRLCALNGLFNVVHWVLVV